jgi:hypothetical protein
MKASSFVYILILGFTLFSCTKDKVACIINKPDCSTINLSFEYIPVCGCDGFTYQNSGYAYCSGISQYFDGECK